MENTQTTLVDYDAIVTELKKSLHNEDSEVVKSTGPVDRAEILRDYRTIGLNTGRQSGRSKYFLECAVLNMNSLFITYDRFLALHHKGNAGNFLEDVNVSNALNKYRTFVDRRLLIYSTFQNKKNRSNDEFDRDWRNVVPFIKFMEELGGINTVYVENYHHSFNLIQSEFYERMAEVLPKDPTIILIG